MSDSSGAVTIGVDVGTTSVKALAVGGCGRVAARARVAHDLFAPAPDLLEHDAGRAWRRGPRSALAALRRELETLEAPIAGACVAAMVPSLTAVGPGGRPWGPGLLYGDARGRAVGEAGAESRTPKTPSAAPVGTLEEGAMPDAEGFLRWLMVAAPDATGYWPAQAVATHALSGSPAIDTAVMMSLGRVQHHGDWNDTLLAELGLDRARLPVVVPMCQPAATLERSDAVITGGTVDALCDQIVSGAVEPGDVLVIFGATLVVWAVTDSWQEFPGLITVPHTVPDRTLIGGPSNAGALFVDWARQLLRGLRRHERLTAPVPLREGDPDRVPVWLPYLRGERTPFNDPGLRASVHGLDITQRPAQLERGVYEAGGFVIRRMLERSGLQARRVVASGGGCRVGPWMAAVADATGLPVDAVAVPEGAALGAAYVARMAAGLENALEGAQRWARLGTRTEPDPAWVKACEWRYRRFDELGAGW